MTHITNHNQNINSLRDMRDNTTHMVFEGEPAVKLHAKNVEVGTSANGNPRQDQVTMGRVDSHLLTTKALVLLGFSIIHHAVIAPIRNLSKVPETIGLPAGLRTTANNGSYVDT